MTREKQLEVNHVLFLPVPVGAGVFGVPLLRRMRIEHVSE